MVKLFRALAVLPMAACVAIAVEMVTAGFLLSLMYGLAKALGAPLKDWQFFLVLCSAFAANRLLWAEIGFREWIWPSPPKAVEEPTLPAAAERSAPYDFEIEYDDPGTTWLADEDAHELARVCTDLAGGDVMGGRHRLERWLDNRAPSWR
ncbi:MAG: hypothetical protein AB7E55_36700 [Pigmentiphaga sp.]